MQRWGEHRSTTFTVPLHRYQEINRRTETRGAETCWFLLSFFLLLASWYEGSVRVNTAQGLHVRMRGRRNYFACGTLSFTGARTVRPERLTEMESFSVSLGRSGRENDTAY